MNSAGGAGNPTTQADAGDFGRYIATDAAVLRQKVSVRLDQLVRPVSLNELVTASAPQPATTANEAAPPPARDPFADDQPAAPHGKIPSGKLMGILGRALLKSAPVDSLEAVREKMADLPLPGETGAAPAAASETRSNAAAAPANDDPFAEPSTAPAEHHNDQPKANADDEDPFG